MADIGSVLNDQYEILGVISQGGLSTVYMAVDRRNNRTWAVKEIRTAPAGGEEGQKASALIEAMMVSKLSHPSIPRIEKVFETEDAFYIVMEYAAGRTLEDTVIAFGPMGSVDAARIGIRLCDVLDYLHALPAPIIFCDLKPSNVILMDRESAVIKLLDFGAARVYEECGQPEAWRFGTTGFTAPELMADGGRVDTRADIYSLGAVLSFLMTGGVPDEDRGSSQGPGGDKTDGLETILRRCLEKNPECRYANCAEVRRDMESYLAGEAAPGPSEKGPGCPGGRSIAAVGKTMKLGTTAQLGKGRSAQERPSESAKRTIGFRPDINILVCGAADRL